MPKHPSLLHWLIVGLSLDAGIYSMLIGGVGLCSPLDKVFSEALLLAGFSVTLSLSHLLFVPWIFRLGGMSALVIAGRIFAALAFGFMTVIFVPVLGFFLYMVFSLFAVPALEVPRLLGWQNPKAIDGASIILIFLLVSIAVGGILGGLLNLFRTAPKFYESSTADNADHEDKNIKRADVRGGALAGLILIGGSILASSLDLLGRPITIPGWLVGVDRQVNAPHLFPAVFIGCAAVLPHLVFLWQKRYWPAQLPMRSGTFTRQETPPSVRPAILCLIFMIVGLGVGLKYEVTVDTRLGSYPLDNIILRIPKNYVYSFSKKTSYGPDRIVMRALIPNFAPHTAANDANFLSEDFGETATIVLEPASEMSGPKSKFFVEPTNEEFLKNELDCLPPKLSSAEDGKCQLLQQINVDGRKINVTFLSAYEMANFIPPIMQIIDEHVRFWAQT